MIIQVRDKAGGFPKNYLDFLITMDLSLKCKGPVVTCTSF